MIAPATPRQVYEELFELGEHGCETLEELIEADRRLQDLYAEAETFPGGGSRALWREISYYEHKVGA